MVALIAGFESGSDSCEIGLYFDYLEPDIRSFAFVAKELTECAGSECGVENDAGMVFERVQTILNQFFVSSLSHLRRINFSAVFFRSSFCQGNPGQCLANLV